MALFRDEVLADSRGRALGSIQLTRPVSFGVLTALVLAVAVGLAAFLVLGEYTRKARLTGHLVPDRGVIHVVSPQPAHVLESHVYEGRQVKQGDILYVLSVDQSSRTDESLGSVKSSLAIRERSLHNASRQQDVLEQARLAGLDRQVVQMRSELAQMHAEADLQGQRMKLATNAQLRLESLRLQNFVSDAQLQAKAEEVLSIRAQVQALERQRAMHQREIDKLLAQRREVPLQAQALRGEIERDLAALVQQTAEADAGRRITLRAPQDGIVTAVLVQQGQSVGESSTLASLLPSNALLQAHLFAPSSAIGFIRPEQAVLLRYQAFPYQKFGHQPGRVLQVARSPVPAGALAWGEAGAVSSAMAAAAATDPVYRITVTLEQQSVSAYGQAQPLVPGMQLDADIQLDRRRLIEWLFEPLLGLAGRA